MPVEKTLQPGERIVRYGYEGGTYVSPEGTPYTERALEPGYINKPYHVYEVVEPVDVKSGTVLPWFDEVGGGVQYQFDFPISDLINDGIIRRIQ